jgi:hypothetical protein
LKEKPMVRITSIIMRLLFFLGLVVAPLAASAQTFTISGGQLLRNGTPFQLLGFALMPDNSPSPPDGATIATQFPGTNFINWASGQNNSGGYRDFVPASNWFSQVNEYLAHGLIVMISDYTPGGPNCHVGSDAQGAFNWYAQWATQYANKANVMFTTQNECVNFQNGGSTAITQYMQGVYNAIRNAETTAGGVKHVIWMEPANDQQNCSTIGNLDPSIFSTMTNVGWNMHTYPWNYPGGQQNNCGGSGTALSDYTNALRKEVGLLQGFARSADGVMPVLMGEGGNSTSGPVDDRSINGLYATVNAWLSQTGVAGGIVGFAAWIHDYDATQEGDSDRLWIVQSNTLSHPYGTQVAARIAASGPHPASLTVATAANSSVGAIFPVSGAISGLTSAPTLQYQDIIGGVAGSFQSLPAGNTVSATSPHYSAHLKGLVQPIDPM